MFIGFKRQLVTLVTCAFLPLACENSADVDSANPDERTGYLDPSFTGRKGPADRFIDRGCRTNSQCPNGYRCMLSTGLCVPQRLPCAPGFHKMGTGCSPCPSGTFSDTFDATSCDPWTDCGKDEHVVTEPTRFNDRKCCPIDRTGADCDECAPGFGETENGECVECFGLADNSDCDVFSAGLSVCIDETCTKVGECESAACNVNGPTFSLAEPSLFHRYPGHEPIVLDNATGLNWQGCSAGQEGDTCTGSALAMTWADAMDYCQNLNWFGRDDWYLPSDYELATLLVFDIEAPTIDSEVFPNTPAEGFWTSSTGSDKPGNAWVTEFGFGVDGVNGEYKFNDQYVRCVRRDNVFAIAERFSATDNTNEPVVTDMVTGLDWQGCMAGRSGDMCTKGEESLLFWFAAKSYCEQLQWGGHSDWRLPRPIEMKSIADNRRNDPAYDPVLFPESAGSRSYWTSQRQGLHHAYWVSRDHGEIAQRYSLSYPMNVRCVRARGCTGTEC